MTLTRPTQTAIFLCGLLLAGLADAVWAPSLWGQALVLAPAVALLGLPHGALDLPMAQALWPLDTIAERARFFAAYLGLAGVIAALWLMAPGFALAAFLAYSALHFSGDWAADGLLLRIAGGLSAVGAPVVLHTVEAATIFEILAPSADALSTARAVAAAGAAARRSGCSASRSDPGRIAARLWSLAASGSARRRCRRCFTSSPTSACCIRCVIWSRRWSICRTAPEPSAARAGSWRRPCLAQDSPWRR